jgi:hypothetical protein
VATGGYRDDPRWLRLSEERRALALGRAEVLASYDALPRRSAEAADEHAARLSLGRSRFFDLLRIWRRTGNPVDLAPHAEPSTKPRTRMDDGRRRKMEQVVEKAVTESKERSPATILAAAARLWTGGKPPSSSTLRRQIDKVLSEERTRPQRISSRSLRSEGDERAGDHGEVVVVDHTAPAFYVDAGDAKVRPTLTLAVDLFTGSVEGYSLSSGLPAPAMVVQALEDAERRGACGRDGRATVRPRLVVSVAQSPEWRDMVAWLKRAGLPVTIRTGYGVRIRRLVGPTMGDVRLHARKAHDLEQGRRDYDPSRDVVLTMAEARMVIEEGISRANEGLFTHVVPRRIVVGLNPAQEADDQGH